MEFVSVELYSDEAAWRERPVVATAEDPSRSSITSDPEQQSKQPSSRTTRTAQATNADYLPPVGDKGAVFESFRVVPDKGVFAGQHNGTILHWKIQQSTSVTPPNVTYLRGHSGAVLTMEFCSSLGRDGLLISGGADRAIKIWDPWRGSEAEQQLHGNRHDHFCVQTLPAHQASVNCIKLLSQQQRSGIVSCSLDREIKIWHAAEGRGLLLYPWFVLSQTISLATTTSWPTCLCILDAVTSCSLFVGDSSGGVSHYTTGHVDSVDEREAPSASTMIASITSGSFAHTNKPHVKLKRKYAHLHSLGVIHLHLICDNNVVVSLGFDQKAHLVDSMSGCVSTTITNRNAARFTSCAWDASGGQCLFLADAMGYVHLWDVFHDKWVKKDKMVPRCTPILTIALQPSADWLFLGTATGLRQCKINRDVGYGECTGHIDAIVGFAVLKDEPLADQKLSNQLSSHMTTTSRFFSVSRDNTLRCWDAYDMKTSFGFEEKQSEITCITVAKLFAKLVTGHERGFIKAWGIHTGQYIMTQLLSRSAVTSLTTGVVRHQEFVFVGDVDDNVFVWELTSDSLSHYTSLSASLSKEPTRRDEISAIHFCKGDYINPQGGSEFIAVGYQTGYVALWSFSKRVLLKAWKAHEEHVTSIARHGCFLFTGSDDATLRMWNCFHLTDPYELGVLRPPGSSSSSGTGSSIVAVDVVQETGAVLAAAVDGTVHAWDYTDFEDKAGADFAAYGKILHRARHNHQLRCMQYWPSKRAMICGTNEGKILVLALPPEVFTPRKLETTISS